jgi:hypothetical protein
MHGTGWTLVLSLVLSCGVALAESLAPVPVPEGVVADDVPVVVPAAPVVVPAAPVGVPDVPGVLPGLGAPQTLTGGSCGVGVGGDVSACAAAGSATARAPMAVATAIHLERAVM